MVRKGTSTSFNMRIAIKIKLIGVTEPEVWRKINVPLNITFHKLHRYIQAAMGWKNSHLYEFKENKNNSYFNIISPHAEDMPGIDARKVNATNILLGYLNIKIMDPNHTSKERMYYIYDYGDNWVHELEILEPEMSDATYAEVLDGVGNCPPEDSGGVPGFQRTKDDLSGQMIKEVYYDWYSAQYV